MKKIESVLFAVKVGEPSYMEEVICTKPEHFENAKKWAKENGFDRLRIAHIDVNEKPDFRKTIG